MSRIHTAGYPGFPFPYGLPPPPAPGMAQFVMQGPQLVLMPGPPPPSHCHYNQGYNNHMHQPQHQGYQRHNQGGHVAPPQPPPLPPINPPLRPSAPRILTIRDPKAHAQSNSESGNGSGSKDEAVVWQEDGEYTHEERSMQDAEHAAAEDGTEATEGSTDLENNAGGNVDKQDNVESEEIHGNNSLTDAEGVAAQGEQHASADAGISSASHGSQPSGSVLNTNSSRTQAALSNGAYASSSAPSRASTWSNGSADAPPAAPHASSAASARSATTSTSSAHRSSAPLYDYRAPPALITQAQTQWPFRPVAESEPAQQERTHSLAALAARYSSSAGETPRCMDVMSTGTQLLGMVWCHLHAGMITTLCVFWA